jgi:hypothetical protein
MTDAGVARLEFQRPVEVIYVILSHTPQVLRLVRTLKAGSPASHVVIHYNYSYSYLDPAEFRDLDGVHIIEPHVPVSWGGFSVVEAVLRAFAWILKHRSFDWMVLISGQDYPIQPLGKIEQFLASTAADGFMFGLPLDQWYEPHARECMRRYYYQYYGLPGVLRPVLGRMAGISDLQPWVRLKAGSPAAGGPWLGLQARTTPFAGGRVCYKGSCWFTLRHRCVAAIDEFVRSDPAYVRYYKRTRIPDESFFQGILLNDCDFTIENDDKRYILWRSTAKLHPDILTVDDFDPMVGSGKHFARKFDASVDARVLDMLDDVVLGGGEGGCRPRREGLIGESLA